MPETFRGSAHALTPCNFLQDSEVEAEEEEEEGFGGRFSTAEEAEAAQVRVLHLGAL